MKPDPDAARLSFTPETCFIPDTIEGKKKALLVLVDEIRDEVRALMNRTWKWYPDSRRDEQMRQQELERLSKNLRELDEREAKIKAR